MLSDYLIEARMADLRQEAMRAGIERAIRELYGEKRPGRPYAVDPALYARYVWYGYHG
ncbi:MAG: hypothetical protein HS107_14210 [Thermoflexaceae bacterium]|nr:hypothetical protein [Thermoflexaceae bacterium]